MKTRTIYIILILGVFVFSSCTKQHEWELVWADEFNYNGLPDTTKWDFEFGLPYKNNEQQFYEKNNPKYSRVENGYLVIEAHKEVREGANYVSASIRTKHKMEFLYGQIETRLKVPKGRGTWPAFWMLGTNIEEVGWPHCVELDIMEYVGYDPNVIHANIHCQAFNHINGTNKGDSVKISNPYEEFHVYAMEWCEDRIDFFVDETKYFSFKKPSDKVEEWPFDKPQFLIINLAIGGNWGGKKGIDDSLFPHKYYVDYVRYYKRSQK